MVNWGSRGLVLLDIGDEYGTLGGQTLTLKWEAMGKGNNMRGEAIHDTE